MKKKSKRLIKLERERFSVFYDDLSTCCFCGSSYQMTKHEIFEGRNRQNSMIYGYVLPLCLRCHKQLQENEEFNTKWKILAQKHFEENVGTREEFIKIFRRNYI